MQPPLTATRQFLINFNTKIRVNPRNNCEPVNQREDNIQYYLIGLIVAKNTNTKSRLVEDKLENRIQHLFTQTRFSSLSCVEESSLRRSQ